MRNPRYLKKGAEYHVCARANRGEMIFNPEWAKILFMIVLELAKQKYNFQLREFCIMNNHIHFIIKPLEDVCLSRVMQWILSVFAMRWNKRMGLSGHVWQGRFYSRVLEDFTEFTNAMLYVQYNPVIAGLAETPEEWRYCGTWYREHGRTDIVEPLPW